MRTRLSLLLFGLAAALCLPAHTARAQGMEPLKLSYPISNSQYWNFNVAIEKGFFRDEKFEPTNTTGMSTPQVIQMIVSGDMHIVPPQPDALIVAMSRGGKDLAVMSQPMLKPDWVLNARPEIKSIKDLKGKVLGASALRGSEFWLTESLLLAGGLQKGDWSVIVVGLTPAKFAALQKGSIAAAVLYEPSGQQAIKAGLPELANFTGLPPYPPGYYTVNRKWAAENNRGQRLSRALKRANEWLWDPKNRAEALTILQKYTKRDPDILEKIYDQYFVTAKLYSKDGTVVLEGLERVLATLIERGEIPKGALDAKQILLPREHGGMY